MNSSLKTKYDDLPPGRGKRVLKPNIGDIVIVCNTEKHNDAKYGIVEGFKSDQSLVIRFRGDSKGTIVPTKLGIPLAAGCLLVAADVVEGAQATYSALLKREKIPMSEHVQNIL